MKITLKRDIASRFAAGESIKSLCRLIGGSGVDSCYAVQKVLRDYMNGRFKLKPTKVEQRGLAAAARLQQQMIAERRNQPAMLKPKRAKEKS